MAGFILSPWRAIRDRILSFWISMTRPTPLIKGVYRGCSITLLIAAFLAVFDTVGKLDPSSAFLQAFAQIAATLLVAYTVVSAWVAEKALSNHGRNGRSARVIGELTAYGFLGLVGIGITLVCADQKPWADGVLASRVLLPFAFASAVMPMTMALMRTLGQYQLHDDEEPTRNIYVRSGRQPRGRRKRVG